MIKKIKIEEYRKLKDLDLDFVNTINFISGTNGTCKTSLLYMISNSFQTVVSTDEWVENATCLSTIKKINSLTNPKIESLTRGDKKYNDPAINKSGILYEVEYSMGRTLGFRKHNSRMTNRYAIKPLYKANSHDSLPACPVIYLGLSRLLPYGEYQNEEAIKDLKAYLPSHYQKEIADIYNKLTGIDIVAQTPQRMGDVKVRADFSTNIDGIDSNTISAGEDNLFILISAVVSLKYYYESINSNNAVESVLLVDELDATLHPSLQFLVLKLLKYYSINYKIQIICTTHSMSLLEYALEDNENIIYLIDNITSVVKMDSPDIYKIKMYLHNITHNDIFLNKAIPIFTEDEEARMFLDILFNYYEETREGFRNVRRFFHLVNANIGSENLISIFEDSYLLRTTMRSICILDGDKKSNYTNCIITLPGRGDSPEKLIMDYSIKLLEEDDSFWRDQSILKLNFGKIYYRDHILNDINNIDKTIKKTIEEGKSTHGLKRSLNKKVFNKHKLFFEMLYKHWIHNPNNASEVDKFYRDLYTMFKKVGEFHEIDTKEWEI